MTSRVRFPAVAGTFYPGRAAELTKEVEEYTRGESGTAVEKLHALGCIVPHAGFIYSGPVAGAVYGALQLPRRYVIMCPNHTGVGEPLAIMSEGAWATPLGQVPVDADLARALIKLMPQLQDDSDAHVREHAVEVQLPFLQKLRPDFSFVPITVGTGQFALLEALGLALAELMKEAGEEVLIIASSDMNHYESDKITRVKDARALERVLAIDPAGLYDVVTRERISMCGFGPAVAMLTAAKRRGATEARLIKYATSGDVSGEHDAVVGYAGVAVLG
jgi:AmmeMemoRadiSam system protein B